MDSGRSSHNNKFRGREPSACPDYHSCGWEAVWLRECAPLHVILAKYYSSPSRSSSLAIYGPYPTHPVQRPNRSDRPYCSYANSVLQALYFCSPFRELLLQSPDPSLSLPQTFPSAATAPASPLQTTPAAARRKPERKQTGELLTTTGTAHASGSLIPTSPATLFSALRSLFIHISKNPLDKGTVAPRAFIEKLKDLNLEFRNTNQQDAHEFLNFLLNKIVEEIMEDRKNQLVNPSRDDCE